MHIELLLGLAACGVGILIGLTGAGGGAVLTPMLVTLFAVRPSTAVASDLVAAVALRPLAAGVHLRRGSVDRRMAALLVAASVPAAVAGEYILHHLGRGAAADHIVERLIGASLLASAFAIFWRRRSRGQRQLAQSGRPVRAAAVLAIGAGGGVMVGLTSIGSGSLMLALLLLACPGRELRQLVGTDLVQSVPLAVAAAAGAPAFGAVSWSVTGSLVLGGVPGVLIGALASAKLGEVNLLPLVAALLLVAGLKYVGASSVVTIGLSGALLLAVLAERTCRQSGETANSAVLPSKAE